jgi:transcription antitermination factor NusG
MMNWYAVYTRPRWEKKVAENLTKRKIENYCPVTKVISQWSDRKKIVYMPLFTSYVFVRVNAIQLSEIRMVDGVINLVYWLGKPAIIRDLEIEMIKLFLNEHKTVQLEKTPVSLNDKVRIINGPLMEKEGSVVGISSNKVKLVLPSLGYLMIAEVAKENVQLLIQSENIKAEPLSVKMN